MGSYTRTKVQDDASMGAPQHDFSESTLVGRYLGTAEVKTTFGAKNLHRFSYENGAGECVVFGRVMLDRLLAKIEPSTLVEVDETGRTIGTKSGGRVKEYEVYTLVEA